MKYPIPVSFIPPSERESINRKVIQLIASSDLKGITPTDIFQAYTGDGGLHGLERKDFGSYQAFSEAKKEIEQGQFFTPASLCEQVVSCVPVTEHDQVADLTFGMGNFFNFLPVEANVSGCELDTKAFNVARYLYPEANLVNGDIRYYRPEQKFDIIFGNPPFNIYWKIGSDEIISQLYFLQKANEVLSPGGIMAVITPVSFLADEFTDKNFISQTEEKFSFLGQAKLAAGAFAQMGVKKFETKVIFLQKRFEGITAKPYSTKEFADFEPAIIRETIIAPALVEKHAIRRKVLFSNAQEQGINNWSFKNPGLRTNDGFEFQIRKLFFELKTHPDTRKNYSKAHGILEKFRTQKQPADMKSEEWEQVKLTENKVLSQLKRLLSKSLNPKPVRTGLLVFKNQHGLTIKSYNKETTAFIKAKGISTSLPFHELVQEEASYLQRHPFAKHLAPFARLVAGKRNNFLNQTAHIKTFRENSAIDKQAKAFTFVHKDLQRYRLNPVQRQDVGIVLQKKFGAILNWQQGGGKTCAAYAVDSLIDHKQFTNTIIVGPPIAIEMTWGPFLNRQTKPHRVIKSISDVATIEPGDVVVIALTSVVKLQRFIKRYLRTIGYKAMLIFDESDEITNYSSKRSHAMRSVFHKVKYKLLTTGTTTRNNIAELYGQLELLHNNSYTMLCASHTIYKEVRTKEDGVQIKSFDNKRAGMPFPGRGGYQLFKSCFSPTKTTVFGIGKHNQDVYNASDLEDIIGSCILTRKFKDIVGPDKYEIHTHTINQKYWEREFYQDILEKFHELIPLFYSSTGNSRKDSMLRILRQLRTLIQACSIPQLMKANADIPRKAEKIIAIVSSMDTRVLIGCTTKKAANLYAELIKQYFPQREVFYITGENNNFKSRQAIIDLFESSENGILVCTQQSLSSSVNLPLCSEVIIESLQWNLPKLEQFYFRTIRFDSPSKSNIHFVIYEDSIEVNIMTLLMDKERLNDFIKTQQFRSVEEVFGDFKLNINFLDMLIEKIKDEDGKVQVKWGKQKLVA